MKNDAFTQKLIDKLQMQELPPQNQQAILDKIETAANMRFANSITELLTDDQLKEVERMEASKASADDVVEWVKQQLPNYDDMLQAIMMDMAEEMVGEQ